MQHSQSGRDGFDFEMKFQARIIETIRIQGSKPPLHIPTLSPMPQPIPRKYL